MEIERKFLITQGVEHLHLKQYPCRHIEQAYLCREPVVRVRQDETDYYLTYKGRGLLAREEYNLPLTKASYEHLRAKSDGTIITKKRYEIPCEEELIIELDIFSGNLAGLILAEVEFVSQTQALNFTPPPWFGREVTQDAAYQNSNLSK